jgi:hypothetical protein
MWEDRVESYELKLDLHLQQVTEVSDDMDEQAEHQILNFSLESGAPYPAARFVLALPVADAWLKMVGRARSGDYLEDRAVEIDESELERIRNAPQQCENCGASFTAPILRGQTDIQCEYCGLVFRI